MSEIKVNNIQSLSGTNGPVISGTVEMDSTGAMSLPRGDTTYRGGRGRGVFGGGRTSPAGLRDTVDYFTIATLGNAIDFGNLTTSTQNLVDVHHPLVVSSWVEKHFQPISMSYNTSQSQQQEILLTLVI